MTAFGSDIMTGMISASTHSRLQPHDAMQIWHFVQHIHLHATTRIVKIAMRIGTRTTGTVISVVTFFDASSYVLNWKYEPMTGIVSWIVYEMFGSGFSFPRISRTSGNASDSLSSRTILTTRTYLW